MPFRTHLGRGLDIRARSNQIMLAIVSLTGIIALVRWLDGEAFTVFFVPLSAFLIWGLGREVDPDHNWTALLGAVVAAVWGFLDVDTVEVIGFAALMGMGRLITNTTGRRLLTIDLIAVSFGGVVIGSYPVGWAAGFGLAIALYVDNQMNESWSRAQLIASAATAIGTTIVAAATGAFAGGLASVVPYMALASGAVALLLAIREPAEPASLVDARHAALISGRRLHASRATVGLVLLGMTLLAGPDSHGLTPAILMLTLALISNEAELARRVRY